MKVRNAWLAALALSPAAASAAGFEIPDNGTQALGRGGSFTAIADDGTAIQYNPAGLAQANGLSITIDANRYDHQVKFQRTEPDGSGGRVDPKEVVNSNPPFLAPLGAITYARELPVGRLAGAVGAYGPSSVGRFVFPRPDPANDPAVNAANRYQLIENNEFIFYPTVSAAYEIKLPFMFAAIGVSGQAVYSSFQFDQMIYAQPSEKTVLGTEVGQGGERGFPFSQRVPPNSPNAKCCWQENGANTTDWKRNYSNRPPTSMLDEDPGWDAEVKVDVKGKWAYTGILGALVKVGPVRAGASFRPGYKLHADGTMKVTLPGVLTQKDGVLPQTVGAQVQGDQASLDLNWPSVFRAGVDVSIPFVPGDLDVSVDYTHETWSVVDEFVLTPHDIKVTSQATPDQTLAPVHIPKHLQDTNSVRAGIGYELPIPVVKLQLRTGGFYEQSAVPDDYTTIDLAHFARVGVSGGASVGINIGDIVGPLMLDLGGMYSPSVTREVRNSQVPLTTSDPFLAHDAVGNGNYTARIIILSAGIRGHFSL